MRFLGLLLAWAIRLLSLSWRVEIDREGMDCDNRNVVYAFRHGDLLSLAGLHRGEGVCVVISQSRDGDLASRVVEAMGYQAIRGSSSRGGVSALRSGVRHLEQGAAVGLAVDGPRGPRGQVGPGVAFLAAHTGCHVRWATVEAAPCVRLNTWDRFAIPLPFCRMRVVYGDIDPASVLKPDSLLTQVEESFSASEPASRGRFSRALSTVEDSLGPASRS